MKPSDTQLSSEITLGRYEALVQQNDRITLSGFVIRRFEERYFRPIESAPPKTKHGFATMAVSCLLIETLESFYQGMGSTQGRSKQMFKDFFARETNLRIFGVGGDWFYFDIRCGILHQGETRNGWKIRRSGPLIHKGNKSINASAFMRELKLCVAQYSNQLMNDNATWAAFIKKMKTVCQNCARNEK